MITLAYVLGLFKALGWHYSVTDDDLIDTRFDGVPMVLRVEQNGVIIGTMIYQATGNERQAMQARSRDIEVWLASVNRVITSGYLLQQDDAVYFFTAASLNGSGQDRTALLSAIRLAVSAHKTIGGVVALLARGQLSLDDALEALRRAEGGAGGSRGRGVA